MYRRLLPAAFLGFLWAGVSPGKLPRPTMEPLLRAVDLCVGESAQVELSCGEKVGVKLLDLVESSDPLRAAVREARVQVEVDGQKAWLTSATYHLPIAVGKVRIDCPITKGVAANSGSDAWGLKKDARLRLWPAGSPLMNPGTFVCPVRQRWLASSTQMANEPCYVDQAERLNVRKIYYHYGLDFGGCEAMTEVVAATDALVVSSAKETLVGYEDTPVSPRYDVVYLLDARGWFYRYSHFHTIDATIRPGSRIRAGQRLGLVGKEGGSGGWTHLHFDIFSRQPSGQWGCQEAYGFVWEAYQRQYQPKLIAVARPHQLVLTGEKVVLDAGRSWSADGRIARFDWTFTDGTAAQGPKVERTYRRPGYYSEVVRVTDAAGRIEHDFAIVVAVDRETRDSLPPSIHVVQHPTLGIRPGGEVTFKARTFGTTDGEETWDFGDGSRKARTKSDGNIVPLAKDGYVVLTHRYKTPGQYLVRVERTDRYGQTAVGYVQVVVEEP